MDSEQYDRIQDQKTMVAISRDAANHWPQEIIKQISYTIRRMNSVIKSSEGSDRVPTTSPEQGEQQ